MLESVMQQQGILHEEASLFVFRHCHAEPAGLEGDIGRRLSSEGRRRAEDLARFVSALHVEFDQIICSAAQRAQDTASLVCAYSACHAWYMGKGLELYSPAGSEDHKAILKFYEENPDAPYCAYRRADTTGIFNRFMNETRAVFAAIPNLGQKRYIAVFGHAVTNNAVVEAFFPQYAGKLSKINLGPGDYIRVTRVICRHVSLSSS